MPDLPAETYQQTRRRLLLKHAVISGIVIAIAWTIWAVHAFRGVDLLHLLSKDEDKEITPTMSLVMAAAVTAIMIGVTIFRASLALVLARRGVEVVGTIVKHGIAFRGMMRVECAYSYESHEHLYIWSANSDTAPELNERVPLLVDPQNPERCLLLEDVFPDRVPDRPKADKPLPERIGMYIIYAIGIFGIGLFAWVAYQKLAAAAKPKPAPQIAAAPDPVPPQPPPQPLPPAVKPPGKEVIFQPTFSWENAKPTKRGAGFFVKLPGGKVAAVTSIQAVSIYGPRLLKAEWIDPVSGKTRAEMDRSWGPLGELRIMRVTAGKDPDGKPINIDIPPKDRRTDHLLMPAPSDVLASVVLELDPRTVIAPGERVYFHDIGAIDQKDYAVIEGTVTNTTDEQYEVELSREIKPASQIGSPVISQQTGKVIGILSSVGDSGGDPIGSIFNHNPSRRHLILTPATAILKALEESHDFPPLREVTGKKAGT